MFIAREGTNVLSWTVPYAAERYMCVCVCVCECMFACVLYACNGVHSYTWSCCVHVSVESVHVCVHVNYGMHLGIVYMPHV